MDPRFKSSDPIVNLGEWKKNANETSSDNRRKNCKIDRKEHLSQEDTSNTADSIAAAIGKYCNAVKESNRDAKAHLVCVAPVAQAKSRRPKKTLETVKSRTKDKCTRAFGISYSEANNNNSVDAAVGAGGLNTGTQCWFKQQYIRNQGWQRVVARERKQTREKQREQIQMPGQKERKTGIKRQRVNWVGEHTEK